MKAALEAVGKLSGLTNGGIEVDDGQKVRLGLRSSTHTSLTLPAPRRSNYTRVYQHPVRV